MARRSQSLVVAVCVALGVALSCNAAPAAPGKSLAAWCTDLECPSYEVVKDYGNNVELRRYQPTVWASTDVQESSLDKASTIGFARLFKYISGDNLLEQRIDMTAPVVTTVRVLPDKSVKDDYTVWFFLPTEGGVRPPGARDPRVTIVDLGKTEAYVLSFDGWALGFRVTRLALDFMDHLENDLKLHDFDRSSFLVGVYDPPYKIWDRHNEIWLLRTSRKPGNGAAEPKVEAADGKP